MKVAKNVAMVLACWAFVSVGSRVDAADSPAPLTPVVGLPVKHDTSPPLRSIVPIPPPASPAIREIPRHQRLQTGAPAASESDPVVQDWHGAAAMPSPTQDFDGIGNVNSVLPPDTNGDVGPNHYVQIVNLSFAIFNKSGTLLYGPAANNTIWAGFGGDCETTNDGDPIVLYDHLADRWLLSQFALPNYPSGPFYQCIAISQTGDPTGAWYRYAFVYSTTKMNDYPKFGVWPDGYYMSVNQFAAGSLAWAGAGVAAFERTRMLAGLSAQMVQFDLYSVNPNFGAILPADLDGPSPPPGSPNYFVMVADTSWGFLTDSMHIWKFHVDWTTPANSTFGIAGQPNAVLNTAAFDPDMCGYSRNCIPQPGTVEKLDALSDLLMYRLQYRNFGTHESLVVNHTVDVGGDHAGIRWYEVRNPGGAPVIYQQGTYAPDANHRWVGSVAMDGAGNMALGFSVASASLYPSIRYVGRLAGDPLGTLPQGEVTLIAGGGSQTHTAHRWGDYSMMAVDPTDNCTFWYTTEYYSTTSLKGWQTRIGSFKFPGCGTSIAPDVKANGSDGPLTIPAGSNLTVTVALDPGGQVGANADWWVAATSPFGLYWYTLNQGWVRSDAPIRTYGGPLFTLAPYTVLNMSTLPIGGYTFYFGVDMLMNGSLDWGQLHVDSVGVTIQ